VKPFPTVSGISYARVDKTTGLLADASCADNAVNVAFLDGTAPTGTCSQMQENPQNFIQKIFGLGGHPDQQQQLAQPTADRPAATQPADSAASADNQQPAQGTKKKNIFQKIFGGGGDKKKEPKQSEPSPATPPQ
jgi:penicillin-binding protein 1B